jgi:hypothetical protein
MFLGPIMWLPASSSEKAGANRCERLIVWCTSSGSHTASPRAGLRLVCSFCRSRVIDMVVICARRRMDS